MAIFNYFKYIAFYKKPMSQNQTTITQSGVSKIAIAVLAVVFGFGLFVVGFDQGHIFSVVMGCLLYTSPSPRDKRQSRMPSSA